MGLGPNCSTQKRPYFDLILALNLISIRGIYPAKPVDRTMAKMSYFLQKVSHMLAADLEVQEFPEEAVIAQFPLQPQRMVSSTWDSYRGVWTIV